MIIDVVDRQKALKFSLALVKSIVKQVINEEQQKCHEVSICFVDTANICELHEQFFDDPSPTDCISFPMDEEGEPYRVLGEVFVCPETALEYAKSHQLDPYEETTLYIVHGLLHLMGYRDMDEEDIVQMRQAEQRHMTKLKEMNLVLTAHLPNLKEK